jgi:hypothetical protein
MIDGQGCRLRQLKATGLTHQLFDRGYRTAVLAEPGLGLRALVGKRVQVKRRGQSPQVVPAVKKPDVLQVVVHVRDQVVEHQSPPQLPGVIDEVLALGTYHIDNFRVRVLVIALGLQQGP